MFGGGRPELKCRSRHIILRKQAFIGTGHRAEVLFVSFLHGKVAFSSFLWAVHVYVPHFSGHEDAPFLEGEVAVSISWNSLAWEI